MFNDPEVKKTINQISYKVYLSIDSVYLVCAHRRNYDLIEC